MEYISKKWKEFRDDEQKEWVQFKKDNGIITSEEVLDNFIGYYFMKYAQELDEKFSYL